VKLEIDDELVSKIVAKELLDSYKYLKKGKHKPPLFSFDPEEEKRLIAEEMAALRLILKTYNVEV
jgi:hypothetical protein